MNYNTTIYNVLHSELINNGVNEIVDNGKIVAFDNDFSFIKKIMKYDKDVEKVVNDVIFNDIKLNDLEHDRQFKRHFLNRFLNHSFKYQTLESTSGMICNTLLNNLSFLNSYYNDIDLFINSKSNTTGKTSRNGVSDSRVASATLPQSEVNINVDNTILDYADENNISRMKDTSNSLNDNESFSYNIDNLEKSRQLLEQVFDEFENNCFMFTW